MGSWARTSRWRDLSASTWARARPPKLRSEHQPLGCALHDRLHTVCAREGSRGHHFWLPCLVAVCVTVGSSAGWNALCGTLCSSALAIALLIRSVRMHSVGRVVRMCEVTALFSDK